MTYENVESDPQAIAIYASPKCCSLPQLKMYKGYFNVAWFVRAYSAILSNYRVITTGETLEAIAKADPSETAEFMQNWLVPTSHAVEFESLGRGFDAQVALASKVAKRQVERVLMFQDPDDVLEHLPEAHALIRNCGLANVGLHINAGATFWAETEWQHKKATMSKRVLVGFGPWRDPFHVKSLHRKLSPPEQVVTFIAHDGNKNNPDEDPKGLMERLVHDYHGVFAANRFAERRYGTLGTCNRIKAYLSEKSKELVIEPLGHGPAGGDVIIADEIIKKWPVDGRRYVRRDGLTHAVVFFINYRYAQPHEADIHVLLRTCLHPARGVHLILNNRTARDWCDALSRGSL